MLPTPLRAEASFAEEMKTEALCLVPCALCLVTVEQIRLLFCPEEAADSAIEEADRKNTIMNSADTHKKPIKQNRHLSGHPGAPDNSRGMLAGGSFSSPDYKLSAGSQSDA